MTQTRKLLQQVRLRQRLAAVGRSLYISVLALVGIYAAVLLVSRLFAVIPDWFNLWTIAVVPVLGLLIAVLFHRRPSQADAARAADQAADAKDLYLTATMLDNAPGAYAPIVVEQAEDKAGALRGSTVVPWAWGQRTGHVTIAMLVLLAGVSFLPQLDPFGVHEQKRLEEERKERLAKSVKETDKKVEALKQSDLQLEHSRPVEHTLEALQKTFNQTKPQDPAGNLRKLDAHRDRLQRQWQAKKLASSLNDKSTSQRFGGMKSEKAKKWEEQLKSGKTEGLKQELSEMKNLAEQIQSTEDEAKRQQLQKELQERLKELSEFAEGQPGGEGMSDALKQAMQQLDMSQMEGLDQEALDALSQSMDLSELELDQMAQNQRDLESLEKAIKALQQAKQLNKQNQMDGAKCEGCNGISEYEKLFAQMLKNGQGKGDGPGMGGPGRGKGNIAPEDDSQQTTFQTEREKSQLQAGKILMSWKDKGVSEAGDAQKDYRKQITEVKQGVSEAITAEEVPPGYHDAIKRYFDTIDRTAPPATTPDQSQ